MRNMGALEAANAIRNNVMLDRSSRATPEEQHELKFVKEVVGYLGLEPSAENLLHIRAVLREQGIVLHAGHEYPKWVTRKYDNTSHLVQNEQEANTVINAEAPPPPEPQPRVVEPPVQPLDIDLKDKVPKVIGGEMGGTRDELLRQQGNPGDRQPSDLSRQVPRMQFVPGHHDTVTGKSELSEITDRDAAQDQHPLGDQHHGEHKVGDEGDGVTVVDDTSGIETDHDKGVFAHDDADRDGIAGQDPDPTHDRRASDAFAPRPHADHASTDEAMKDQTTDKVEGTKARQAEARGKDFETKPSKKK